MKTNEPVIHTHCFVTVVGRSLNGVLRQMVLGGGSSDNQMHEREAKKPKTGGRSGGPLDLAAQPRFAAKPRRLQRLQLRVTGYNTGNCFVAALLTHIAPSKPTTRDIVDLRTEAGLPARGATDGVHMVQLLSHLSYGCVIVDESHSRATILNAAGASSCYVTVARKGSAHVEPVALSGTVQVRTLDEIIGLLRVCGVQVQLPVPRPEGQEGDLADVISLTDDEDAPAEQHTTNDGDTALLEHNRHRPHRQ